MEVLVYSNKHNVDAGLIGIFSTSWISHHKGVLISSLELDTAVRIKIRVLDTWKGTILSRPKLLRKGYYYIGDPCYLFNETWDSVLLKTNYFNRIPKNCIRVNTGGDGAFTIEVLETR